MTWYLDHLACPDCEAPLARTGERVACGCGFSAAFAKPLDLRPQRPRPRTVAAAIGSSAAADLEKCPIDRPPPVYAGPKALRDSDELFSAAASWLPKGARLLDVGCGPRDQAVPAAHLGLQYAGFDWSSPEADILADAHAIPFREATFDAALAYAVVEHLYNPFLAVREIGRILKPGGIFFGAVSQGEPFHDSFFHHTAWGVMSVFASAGFDVLRLWPSYDTLHSLAAMGRYSRVVRSLIELVYRLDRAMPFLAPRQFLRASARQKQLENLYRAASICFVAAKHS
jgi:SAM-dependent methyltransferase